MPNETDNEEGARGNVSRRNFFERIGVAGAVAAMPTGPVPAAAQTPAIGIRGQRRRSLSHPGCAAELRVG